MGTGSWGQVELGIDREQFAGGWQEEAFAFSGYDESLVALNVNKKVPMI